MPRGHLNERYVKEVAVERLATHYSSKRNSKVVVPTLEACVSKSSKLGFGRADGLIAIRLKNDLIYTISVEAKSHRTWKNLSLDTRKDMKALLHSLAFAGLSLFIVILLGITANGGLLWGFVVFIVALGGFIGFASTSDIYQPIEVIKQVKGYPANEKWIVLSTDVYNLLVDNGQESDFRQICVQHGIGLGRVSPNRQFTVILDPKPNVTPKQYDSFLACYSRKNVIQSALDSAAQRHDEIAEVVVLEEVEAEEQPEENDTEIDEAN